MSELDSRFVKLGSWTNLEQGNVMGRTITTDSRTGAIVIAILAVMSTIASNFTNHTNPKFTDGRGYQIVVVLEKNSQQCFTTLFNPVHLRHILHSGIR
ncbi:hypothetical protein HBH68_230820 [Parastagonospora nodorum]|nr:hypothetical protein HBH52_110460 [Parastagonospora nodorum]KAH5168041.1 hypothetical protein HBH68_230820 [Parastagonospora nodorum]KAH6317976.1 hypothetical protein HBI39_021170 [Parastagonospora nodorum]KAH6469035.1 hypothetical protein HBI59_051970 [Parastagonospora nodorum]